VPPEPSQYVLDEDVTRASDQFDLSTHVTATWTFSSQHVDGATQHLPLPTLRFFPLLDEHNQTSARVLVLPIRIERPVNAPAPDIARVSVEASFDDGATWRPANVVSGPGGTWIAKFVAPSTGYVSLRATASDNKGNSIKQDVIRAYGLG